MVFYYRALHAVKLGLGFQDLIRLLDFWIILSHIWKDFKHTLYKGTSPLTMKGLIYLGLCSALHPSSGEGTLLCHTCYDKSPRLTRSHSGGTFQSNRVASYDKPGVLLRNYCNLYPHTTSGSVVQYHLYAKYLLIIKRALYFVFKWDIKQLNRPS